jgi:hypothetical protein
MFQAKHLLAYEAVARMSSVAAKASVNEFYGLLPKAVDGGIVESEYSGLGGKLGLNFLSIDKTALKTPESYAIYLKGLIDHELTHFYANKSNPW